MARNPKQQTTDVEAQIRPGFDPSKRLPFDHIIEANKDKYDFIIVNDAKYSVQRHEMAGWSVWNQDRLFDSDFEKKTGANEVSDGYASVPCGIGGEGKPTRAYLMYAPKGHYQKTVDARNAENRKRKAGYNQAAEQAGQQASGGMESYNPSGFGGLQVNTVNNSQS